MDDLDIQAIVRQAIQDYASAEQAKSEPAYKAELVEERKRREQMERRLNELVEENKRSRAIAAEAERSSMVRAELQRLAWEKSTSRTKRCKRKSCGRKTAASSAVRKTVTCR